MNKAELINAMAEKSSLSNPDSEKALEGFVRTISVALASGNKVNLVRFVCCIAENSTQRN